MLRHDMRRSAVRNMVNRGISEGVAMSMTGHKSRVVFDRYHIVSPTDLKLPRRSSRAHFLAQRAQSRPLQLTQPSQVCNKPGHGGVAQLVEQRTHKPRVPRSIRGTATNNSRNL